MSWAVDDQVRNGLHHKKTRLILSSLSLLSWKIAKTQIMVYFLLENSLDIFLFVLYKHFQCTTKVLSSNLW